jgi:hypothetical protein
MTSTLSTLKGRKPVYHLAPRDDLYKHTLDAAGTCWCCPEKDEDDPDSIVFVHFAYDRREEYEEGLRQPN